MAFQDKIKRNLKSIDQGYGLSQATIEIAGKQHYPPPIKQMIEDCPILKKCPRMNIEVDSILLAPANETIKSFLCRKGAPGSIIEKTNCLICLALIRHVTEKIKLEVDETLFIRTEPIPVFPHEDEREKIIKSLKSFGRYHLSE